MRSSRDVIAALLVAVGIALNSNAASDLLFSLDVSWIERWQTLLAGALALCGAIATVVIITRQIRTAEIHISVQERQYNEVRRGKYIGARAKLSMAISDMCRECDRTIGNLLNQHDLYRMELRISYSELDAIIETIEHADPTSARNLSIICSEIQVVKSRIERNRRSLNRYSPEFRTQLYDLCHLKAALESTFPFTRQEEDVLIINITQEDIKRALRLNGARPEIISDLSFIITHRIGSSPFNYT